jgi:hypothetical protein
LQEDQEMATLNVDADNPATWDLALDAVVAAPRHHRVLFENDNLRVLEVTLEHLDEEPVHHHRWPSVFVFDQVGGPIHDIAPDGTPLPPNVIQAIGRGTERGAWWSTWRLRQPAGFSMSPAGPFTASG